MIFTEYIIETVKIKGVAMGNFEAKLCYIDAGGTFTDGFLMSAAGDYVYEKTPSTPHDVSIAFFDILRKLAKSAELGSLETLTSQLDILGFGATLVVNALLTRTGRKCGMIVTKGHEDIFEIARGKGGWCHLESIIDRLHPQAHFKPEPIISRHLIRGVSELTDRFGNILVHPHEEEVRQATKELLEEGVEAIVVLTLWDFLNPANEKRIVELVTEIAGGQVEIYEGAEICPIIRDWPRACTVAVEAYTAGLLGRAVKSIAAKARQLGFKKDILMMQSSGGVVTAERTIAVNTVQSGPVGGLIGGRFLGQMYGVNNVITSDVGGTSFDVGLIRDGTFVLESQPVVLNMVLNVPICQVVSIGAGGGSIAGVDKVTGRLMVGPQSAGADPGPVCYGKGGEYPTVTDADVVLGYIDPDYFLGGEIKLDKAKAISAIMKYVGEPLGMSAEESAWSIRALIDAKMGEAVRSQLIGKGLDPREFMLLAFGGAGPTHFAGYSSGIPLRSIKCFPFSPVFSAFGATTADIERTRTKSLGFVILPNITDKQKLAAARAMNEMFDELEKWVRDQLLSDGVPWEKTVRRRFASMRYGRQLNDLIVELPMARIDSVDDFDALIDAFEKDYVKLYSMSAKFARAGYEIYEISITASYSNPKPVLRKYERGSEIPPAEASKSVRQAFFGGRMLPVKVYDMDKLRPGNIILGPCIVESKTTTAVIPEDSQIEVDEYKAIDLKRRQ